MSTPQPPIQKEPKHNLGFFHSLDLSAVLTLVGIIILFSGAIVITLLAPRYVDPTWTSPTSAYQVQMYEVADPNFYISSASIGSPNLQFIYHVKNHYTLSLFKEEEFLRIVFPKELNEFVTKYDEKTMKLTSRLLLLRKPQKTEHFDAIEAAKLVSLEALNAWEKKHSDLAKEKMIRPTIEVLELYAPEKEEAFALAGGNGAFENWIDKDYKIIDKIAEQEYHKDPGVIYIYNPQEYLVTSTQFNDKQGWNYDPVEGKPIESLSHLKNHPLGFHSRKELIAEGENIYAIEGCWYCHTDQTRTLVQDVVSNGSDSYPAPPSSANEYIYQKVTFPGTRRIGPDISRVGIKRPSRDWHKGHFWSPKTASAGSIMPAFRHFFDEDPRGTSKNTTGIPNYKFEAIFQYLMTKGTRITPPTQAWWEGKDPVNTKKIIEGRGHAPG